MRFDDVEESDLPYAPTASDIEQIIKWVGRLPDDARLVIHCTAGVSRSTAIAFALLYQKMEAEPARDRLLEIRPQASPNALITKMLDQVLEMDGALHATALEIRIKDPVRPLPGFVE